MEHVWGTGPHPVPNCRRRSGGAQWISRQGCFLLLHSPSVPPMARGPRWPRVMIQRRVLVIRRRGSCLFPQPQHHGCYGETNLGWSGPARPKVACTANARHPCGLSKGVHFLTPPALPFPMPAACPFPGGGSLPLRERTRLSVLDRTRASGARAKRGTCRCWIIYLTAAMSPFYPAAFAFFFLPPPPTGRTSVECQH